MDQSKIKRVKEGVVENTDQDAYDQYIAQRNMMNQNKTLQEQINMLVSRIDSLEKQQKVS